MNAPKITTTFSGFGSGLVQALVGAAVVYYFAGQWGWLAPTPIPVEQEQLPPVVQRAADAAEHNRELLQDLYSGTAPRNRNGVPLWHRQHEDMRDLIVALQEVRGAAHGLTAELEDYTHQRPLPRTTSTTTTQPPDDLSLIERIIRWMNS